MKYDPALDGLRAISVTAVVLYHVSSKSFCGGWAGVDVFFVLSGFLITRILEAEFLANGKINFRRFYIRRSLRLMPALATLLITMGVVDIFSSQQQRDNAFAILYSASYLMNWVRAFSLGPQWVLGHTWSLAMEEQFYLIWPALFLVLRKWKPKLAIGSLVLAMVAWRSYLSLHGADSERTYNGFDTHADGLLIGCFLALTPWAKRDSITIWWHSAIPCVLLLLLFIFVPLRTVPTQTVGLSISAILGCCLIIVVQGAGWLRTLLSLRPLVFTGRISYGIYLWHHPLIAAVGDHKGFPKLAMVVLAYLVAAASFKYVERPFLKMKLRVAA